MAKKTLQRPMTPEQIAGFVKGINESPPMKRRRSGQLGTSASFGSSCPKNARSPC